MHITPTYQTTTGTGKDGDIGNCMVASIATITGINLADIPHFVENHMNARGYKTAEDMQAEDWLTLLAGIQTWLKTQGWDSAPCERIGPTAELFGAPVYVCLALVMTANSIPHIIVTDQRGMQMWDPNPTTTEPYKPTDVLAMLAVTRQ